MTDGGPALSRGLRPPARCDQPVRASDELSRAVLRFPSNLTARASPAATRATRRETSSLLLRSSSVRHQRTPRVTSESPSARCSWVPTTQPCSAPSTCRSTSTLPSSVRSSTCSRPRCPRCSSPLRSRKARFGPRPRASLGSSRTEARPTRPGTPRRAGRSLAEGLRAGSSSSISGRPWMTTARSRVSSWATS
jgi:hypothetical protein